MRLQMHIFPLKNNEITNAYVLFDR